MDPIPRRYKVCQYKGCGRRYYEDLELPQAKKQFDRTRYCLFHRKNRMIKHILPSFAQRVEKRATAEFQRQIKQVDEFLQRTATAKFYSVVIIAHQMRLPRDEVSGFCFVLGQDKSRYQLVPWHRVWYIKFIGRRD